MNKYPFTSPFLESITGKYICLKKFLLTKIFLRTWRDFFICDIEERLLAEVWDKSLVLVQTSGSFLLYFHPC